MNKKVILFFLILFFLASTGCGILGYIKHNEKKDPVNNNPENKVIYNYYLEDEKVNDIPKNNIVTDEEGKTTTEVLYVFKKYVCTNNLTGNFDTVKWQFEPIANINSVCDIYFVKSNYEIDLNVINGIEDENNLKKIERETDGIFKITPNEGYQFKESICSNDKNATWDESTNSLIINAVMSDIACNVKFEKKNLRVDISVVNGVGNTTENVYYGDNKTIVVEPKDGFNNPKISCTNKQEATFDNNNLTFDKITNNTVCKVTFQKIPVVTYNLTITNPTEKPNITIISGNEKQSITSGKDGKIVLKSTDGSTPALSCGDVLPSLNVLEELELSKTIEFTFLNVTKNITCKIESN